MDFSSDTWTKCHCTSPPRVAAFQQLTEYKKDRRRRHVSVVSQDTPRNGQGVSGNSEPSLDSIEDRAATWMDSPKGDVLPFCPREQYGQSFRKMITDGSGDLAGKMHLETRCADAPGDELGGVRQYRRSEIDHFKSGGFAADNAGCTAIREQQGSKHVC